MKNPFDITQYSNNLTIKSDINLSGIGVSGIGSIFSFLIREIKIRQESIRSGYISGIADETLRFVDVDKISWDTPESISNSCNIIISSINQFYKSGNGFWDKYATVYCDSGSYYATGFFTNKMDLLVQMAML